MFSLVFCFLDLGPILDLEERRVKRICFYLLAKKSAVVLLLQITSVYRCLNNFLVKNISCESGRYLHFFVLMSLCVGMDFLLNEASLQ